MINSKIEEEVGGLILTKIGITHKQRDNYVHVCTDTFPLPPPPKKKNQHRRLQKKIIVCDKFGCKFFVDARWGGGGWYMGPPGGGVGAALRNA